MPKLFQSPGEDIRAAKAIYEYVYGDFPVQSVKEWMGFAKDVQKHFNCENIQETAKHLQIQTNRR